MRNLLLAIALCQLLGACKSKPEPSESPAPLAIHTARVQLSKAPHYKIYPATIFAYKEVMLIPQISGYITQLAFQDGDLVRKGQLLYTIDSTIYAANVHNALATLHMREAELDKADKDRLRYRELLARQAISQQQVDYAESAYTQAYKLVEAARASLQAQRSNLEFSKVYAPFTGTIGISKVRIGSNVIAGQTVLNTLSSNDPMYVDFFVEQGKIAEITQLSQSNPNAFKVFLNDYDLEFPAKLELLDRALDSETGSIRVRLRVDNSQRQFRAGMNVSVKVLTQAREQVMTIPYRAVTPQMGEFYVYVIQADSTVRQQYIHLGAELGAEVIVTQGLKPNTEIALDGLQKLREGMQIRRIAE